MNRKWCAQDENPEIISDEEKGFTTVWTKASIRSQICKKSRLLKPYQFAKFPLKQGHQQQAQATESKQGSWADKAGWPGQQMIPL